MRLWQAIVASVLVHAALLHVPIRMISIREAECVEMRFVIEAAPASPQPANLPMHAAVRSAPATPSETVKAPAMPRLPELPKKKVAPRPKVDSLPEAVPPPQIEPAPAVAALNSKQRSPVVVAPATASARRHSAAAADRDSSDGCCRATRAWRGRWVGKEPWC